MLPKGKPFVSSYNAYGIKWVAGYIYENGQYGSVITCDNGGAFNTYYRNGGAIEKKS